VPSLPGLSQPWAGPEAGAGAAGAEPRGVRASAALRHRLPGAEVSAALALNEVLQQGAASYCHVPLQAGVDMSSGAAGGGLQYRAGLSHVLAPLAAPGEAEAVAGGLRSSLQFQGAVAYSAQHTLWESRQRLPPPARRRAPGPAAGRAPGGGPAAAAAAAPAAAAAAPPAPGSTVPAAAATQRPAESSRAAAGPPPPRASAAGPGSGGGSQAPTRGAIRAGSMLAQLLTPGGGPSGGAAQQVGSSGLEGAAPAPAALPLLTPEALQDSLQRAALSLGRLRTEVQSVAARLSGSGEATGLPWGGAGGAGGAGLLARRCCPPAATAWGRQLPDDQ
jgi:hypothetical protein